MAVTDGSGQRTAIRVEVERIHESAVHSAQGQFEAAKLWRLVHWTLGVLAAALSTVAAMLVFASDAQLLSGACAVLAAIAAAILTSARPDKLAERAQGSGNGYTTLRNVARRLRDIQVPADSLPDLREALIGLADRASELDHSAEPIPRWAYKRAKRNIERDGGQTFEVDGV